MTVTATATDFLDAVAASLRSGHVQVGIETLFVGLRDVHASLDPTAWRQFVTHTVRQHPSFALVLRCPMVHRALDKPRGYAGDAELIDYLYRLRRPIDDGCLGARIWDHLTLDRPAALAVRKRRDVLAACLDRLASAPAGRRRALSVAAGHFREGLASEAVRRGALDRIVALDSDQRSLDVVTDCFPDGAVETELLSVKELLRPEAVAGPFDLIYSAGLYDYLDQRFATRLTTALFDRVAPGGELVLCNFVPELYDIGFMDAFMGWELIYRTPAELRATADDIPAERIAAVRQWTDAHRAVAYLELTKSEA